MTRSPVDSESILAANLRRRADRICSLIVGSDYPDIDIEIEVRALRRWCRDQLPDRLELFDMIYGSRFQRLRQQFRQPQPPLSGEDFHES